MAAADASTKGPEVEHISYSPPLANSVGGPAFQAYYAFDPSPPRRDSDDAREGLAKERKMSFLGGCRLYPAAIAWSVLLSLTIVMEAFDKILIAGFFA